MIQLTYIFLCTVHMYLGQQYLITISGWLYYPWSHKAAGTVLVTRKAANLQRRELIILCSHNIHCIKQVFYWLSAFALWWLILPNRNNHRSWDINLIKAHVTYDIITLNIVMKIYKMIKIDKMIIFNHRPLLVKVRLEGGEKREWKICYVILRACQIFEMLFYSFTFEWRNIM